MVSKVNHQTNFESKKWFRDKRKMSLARAIRKMIDRFLKAFILKQGFRDGFTGFMLALMSGFYQILSYAKYAELKNPCHCERPQGAKQSQDPIKSCS